MNWPALANRRFGLSCAARRRYNRGIEALLAESEEAMRSKVTEAGVILPRQWFPGVEEVEIRRENDRVVVRPFRPDDPIRQLPIKSCAKWQEVFRRSAFRLVKQG